MKSYRTGVKPHRRSAAKFVAEIHREIQKAYLEEMMSTGINQSKIADALGVNRSVISKQMRGTADISSARIGEIAWALGRKAKLTLEKPAPVPTGSNVIDEVRIVKFGDPTPATVTNANAIDKTAFVVTKEERP